MSKSKGEFLTVSLLKEKGYDPLVYRFFCLQSHYRKSLAFSYEALDNAGTAYEKLVARIAALKPEGEANADKVKEIVAGFDAALDNDLNTSLAITALYDALKADAADADKLAAIAEMDEVLSLGLIKAAEAAKEKAEAPAADGEFGAWIEEMIAARAEAKKAKNYAEADRIRAELSDKGVTLIDTKEGTKYEIK